MRYVINGTAWWTNLQRHFITGQFENFTDTWDINTAKVLKGINYMRDRGASMKTDEL